MPTTGEYRYSTDLEIVDGGIQLDAKQLAAPSILA